MQSKPYKRAYPYSPFQFVESYIAGCANIYIHMGNSLHGVSLVNNVHLPSHIQLGSYAAIDAEKTEEKLKGGHGVMWTVSYTVDGSVCRFTLGRRFFRDGKVIRAVWFGLHDDICSGGGIHLIIEKAQETNLLKVSPLDLCGDFSSVWTKTSKTIHARGGVTETTVFVYGSGNKGGLIVVEWKKKSRDEKPYMGTVAHYYATASGNFFGQTRIDVGLSVVAKVQASNDEGLDIMAEGPVQHPAAALFYMFDEVKRTGNWNPTACPHCANIQKQRRASMFGQSESEESDSSGNGSGRNAMRSILENRIIKGNGNGNIIGRDFYF